MTGVNILYKEGDLVEGTDKWELEKLDNRIKTRTMEEFKIEKWIPIPKIQRTWTRYPFREMEIDDSFLVENYSRGKMNNILSAGRNFAAKSGDCTHYKFATRKEGNNIRIWRVK